MRRTLTVLFGMSCLLLADDDLKQKVRVVHTERADFPSGGLLRFKNSAGELTVEGWDRPDVEITTIKSTKDALASREREKASLELDKLHISTERKAEELVVTTDSPRHRGRFDLEYHVKAPINARLAVDHDTGEIHVVNLTANIQVTVHNGEITLSLPEQGLYGIDARVDAGDVTSDFPGHAKRARWLLGHHFMQSAPTGHNLYLRVGFGDISIMKIHQPPTLSPPRIE